MKSLGNFGSKFYYFECDENCYIKVLWHQEHDGGLSFVITHILNTVSPWLQEYNGLRILYLCFGSFNVKQTLGERDAGIQTWISLHNKQNIIKTRWKNHKSILII